MDIRCKSPKDASEVVQKTGNHQLFPFPLNSKNGKQNVK